MAVILMLHHPVCFSGNGSNGKSFTTPIQRLAIVDRASRIYPEPDSDPIRVEINQYSTVVRVNPSKLPSYYECPRCHWMEVRAGLEPGPIVADRESSDFTDSSLSFDPATFGTVFHRIIEIGIGNPGPGEKGPSRPLPKSWSTPAEDRITDEGIHTTAFNELLPPGTDIEKVAEATRIMAKRISEGKIGEMVRGKTVDGRDLEGLRTELPFHISIPINFDPITRG